MVVEEKKTSDSLEETKTVKRSKINYPKKHAITIDLTTYQKDLVDSLVEIGIASSPTAFGRVAILEMVRVNRHLLNQKINPPRKFKPKKSTKEKRSQYLDDLVKKVLEGEENLSPKEIINLRNRLTIRIARKESFTDEEIQAIKKDFVKRNE